MQALKWYAHVGTYIRRSRSSAHPSVVLALGSPLLARYVLSKSISGVDGPINVMIGHTRRRLLLLHVAGAAHDKGVALGSRSLLGERVDRRIVSEDRRGVELLEPKLVKEFTCVDGLSGGCRGGENLSNRGIRGDAMLAEAHGRNGGAP